MTRPALFAAFQVLLLTAPVSGSEGVDYARDVKPILKARCYACHGALKQKSDLRLDTGALVREGGDSGPAIEPGSAARSLLIERVTAKDEADRMPPEGDPLSPRQIEILRAWIDLGAQSPAGERPEEDAREHWAFQRPRRADPPSGTGTDATAIGHSPHPIDRFVAAEYRKRGLKPVAPADRRTLLRRVYLDLIGLPPTRSELEAFDGDTRPDAYERIVDRLLASPRHGERWARHWMDVWRYSDWYGLGEQLRYSQKHIWHWRDWIIESLNEDKGYDRMVLEMLAADELAPTDSSALRATGFLARNYFLFNRDTWLDNTIEHTSKALLGLTMNCAKCHDHKYDPIRQVDYYRMRAFFEPHQVRLDTRPGETDLEKDGIPRVFDAHPDAPTYLQIRGNAKDLDRSRRLEPGVPEVLAFEKLTVTPVALPPGAHSPELREFVLEDYLRASRAAIDEARAAVADTRVKLAAIVKSGEAAGAAKGGPREGEAADPGGGEGVDKAGERTAARRGLALAEQRLAAAELRPDALRSAHAADVAKHDGASPDRLKPLIASAASAARRYELAVAEARVLEAERELREAKGDKRKAAEKAHQDALAKATAAREALTKPGESYTSPRASLKALEGPDETDASRRQPYPGTSTGRRTALARWIVDERNPLTARVAVNHVWMRHFGQPLVESVADLGRRAAPPPHRALLDRLAVELMDSGWSMKHLHRLIVTSRVYQLSSSTLEADDATRRTDPENMFYWRRRPMRMESQVVRDAMLHLADRLDRCMGGPSLEPAGSGSKGPEANPETRARRSLYFKHSRDQRDELLAMFDDADILACYRRSESIVPQQALALSNGKLARLMARAITGSLSIELGSVDDECFVKAAFETVLAARPTAEEIAACREALADTRRALAAAGSAAEPSVTAARARENLVHALFNHNDFITIR